MVSCDTRGVSKGPNNTQRRMIIELKSIHELTKHYLRKSEGSVRFYQADDESEAVYQGKGNYMY